MKIHKLTPQIYFLECKDIIRLSLLFMRFQEYYENPKFKGKVFTVKEFKTWYRKKFKRFTYCTDWGGFNIPSSAIEPFRNGEFKRLTKLEKEFIKEFPKREKPYYVIGALEFNSETFNHEMAHALFFTDADYKNSMIKDLKKINLNKVYGWFEKLGYHRDVWEDEAQAYISSEIETLTNLKLIDPKLKEIKKMQSRLQSSIKNLKLK